MTRDRRAIWAVSCGIALACAAGVKPVRESDPDPLALLALDSWRRAEIAGLTVYTNASDAETRSVLRRMEQFVAFLSDFLGDFRLDGDPTPPLPTNVFLFAEEEQLRLFTPEPKDGGFGVAGYVVTDAPPTASLASSVRASLPALAVFRHELVHVVYSSDPARHPPRWAQEGLAVYFATVTLRDDVLTLGAPSGRLLSLAQQVHRPLPLAKIFSWDGEEAIDMDRFYTDAWAFVHYGLESKIYGGPDRVRAFRAFLDRIERGEAWKPALETAFGAELPVVEAEFLRHRRRLLEAEVSTVVHLRVPIPNDAVTFEGVPEDEIARRLGDLASQVGDWAPDTRRRLYDHLLASNDRDPQALVGRMRVAVIDEDPELAARLFGRVPPESRGTAQALLARAELVQARWLAEPAETRDREGFLEARDAWQRVLALQPEHLPALVALGRLYVEAETEDPRVGVDALQRAVALDPHRHSIRLDLGRLLIRAGENDAARRVLGDASMEGSPDAAREARRLLRKLH